MRIREVLGWLIAAGLLVAVVSTYLPRGEAIAGDMRVVDGDSLHVGDTEVRLFGVDAFEGRQVCSRDGNPWRCGEAAADELRKLAAGRPITCSKKDTDSYGRTVAVCSNGTADLGAEVTRAGLALAYREFSDDYVDDENEAFKGNISRNGGERIYHVRGSSSYEETVIDEPNGERWFCTEEDARRAGWRPRR